MELAILGGGRWGTALALHLSRKGHKILIYDINERVVSLINEGTHPYIEGMELPGSMKATTELSQVENYDTLICALPTQTVRDVLSQIKLSRKKVINASKGLELGTLKRVSQIVEEIEPSADVFALSGPSFAEEVSKGLPTAVVLAYKKAKDSALELQEVFNAPQFRVYLNEDIAGVELGGALKNVIAIACGVSDGMGLGFNSRAALITRGLNEMARIGELMGGRRETFFGLSGMGDLVLTATSDLSRNRTFGLLLGKGVKPREALKRIGQVVEGVKTVEALWKLIEDKNIHAPITEAVYRVAILGESLEEVLRDILLRAPGQEFVL